MSKIKNLINFYNRPVNKIIDNISKGFNNYPFQFREMLNKYGDEIINSIYIVRSPLSSILYKTLNTLTFGQLDQRIQESEYDKLFHLKVIINNKYSIEKNATISFTVNNNIPVNSEIRKVNHIPYNLTIKTLCDNCYTKMGNEMFNYNSKHNNCQVFIKNLLETSGMFGNEIFIMQDIKQIFHGLTFARKVMNTVTDIGNRANMMLEGNGLKQSKHEHKLTSLSDSDLCSIAIFLKLNLVGIYMKDDLKSLKEGFYIINLQDHNKPGSHWTSFIKNQNDIYYFDSFGAVPPQNEYDLFKRESENIFYNELDLQNIDASSCGWWCIAFLYFMKNTKGTYIERFKKFNKKFSTDTKKNELILKKYIDKIYIKKI